MTVHDIKDLAMIYNDCDKYKVVVWDPVQQKTYDLIFTGSSNVDKAINFNISEVALTAEERERINTLNEAMGIHNQIKSLTKRYKELTDKLFNTNTSKSDGICEENK